MTTTHFLHVHMVTVWEAQMVVKLSETQEYTYKNTGNIYTK